MSPLALSSWVYICTCTNALSVASSLEQLRQRGILAGLSQWLRIGDLGGNPGYLHGLFRALDSLGWLDREGSPGSADMRLRLSPLGQQILANPAPLAEIPALLQRAPALAAGDYSHFQEGPTPADELGQMLEACQLAPLILGCMVYPEIPLPAGPERLLQRLGWRHQRQWTQAGRIALLQGHVFHYPLAYLETLIRIDELLFGDALALRQRKAGGEETHVDRRRDIHFSGKVYSASVAPILNDLFLPLFQKSGRPKVLVDVGCGDGQMLAELGRQVTGTRLVGVEYNPVARSVAAETLAEFPEAFTLAGDIADPVALAADLQARGIDLDDVLYVTKSVVHNRPYRQPQAHKRQARSCTAVSDSAGQVIANADLEANLVEFFQSWRPFLQGHGFLIVEAHTVPTSVARSFAGRSLAPCLDATHCFSGQLLVEADVFRDCAREAGLTSLAGKEIGAAAFGHNHMTVDHFHASDELSQ